MRKNICNHFFIGSGCKLSYDFAQSFCTVYVRLSLAKDRKSNESVKLKKYYGFWSFIIFRRNWLGTILK